ncbi:MAG: TMEM175 family protein [Ignavibacterium sp.]|jgi:uncharacterized membrane protein|nr:TMEM175 family protein [Ignavibacterium sp.]
MSKSLLEKNRLEAFSDGVIAIIITLLVLEIKVPHIHGDINSQKIIEALFSIAPKFFSWALSFFMLLIMWINHHRIFNELEKSDNNILWLNGMLLFFMSFVPFPTAFMGDYFTQPMSTFFFGICLMLVGIAFYFLRAYLVKKPQLFKKEVDLSHQKKLAAKTLLGPAFYFIGAISSFLSIIVAYIIYVAVPVYYIYFGIKRKD